MPKVRMKVEASGGLGELSAAHPEATFRILSSLTMEPGHMTLVEVEDLDAAVVEDYLENDQDVLEHDVLHTNDRQAIFQFLQASEPKAGHAGRESGNPPPYPMVVRDGWVHAESTTTHDRLTEFRSQLDAHGVKYDILSVTRSQNPEDLLTDRQREFVTEAIERGYYDSPRRCSLTELADALGVNKATASGILHRAESAITYEFMKGSSLE